MAQETSVELINKEINHELSNEGTSRALMATTFKGLKPEVMKQAIMEGMIRGYTFRDFLTKEVYATPFGDGYSIVESIGRVRKIATQGGVNGNKAPTYKEDANGNIIWCSKTVFKQNGHPGGYTAKVWFSEYSSNKPIWKSKPHTMIAKVAEMHALRMACPERLSGSYIEEEFDAPEDRQADRFARAQAESNGLTMGAIKKDHEDKKTEETQDGKSSAPDGIQNGQ